MIDDGDDDDHPALHSLPCEENVGRVVQHNLQQEMSIKKIFFAHLESLDLSTPVDHFL